MSQRHPMAVIAGAATLLAAFPLTTVFASFTWLFFAGVAVVIVVGTGMLVRTLRGPAWVQVLAMTASLLLYLTWSFPVASGLGRLIPTAETFRHFNALLVAAGQQIRDEAAPVPDLDGLLLLTTAGVGLVAVLVDLAAVGLRRPALAGLPMLAIYSVPVAVLPDGLSIFPFVFAAAGFLWLLVADSVDRVRRFGRRFTGEGRDVDLWEPSPLSAAGRRLGAVGVVIAMLLPLAVPGMTSGLIDRFGTGGLGPAGEGSGTGGGGPTVNLSAMLRDNLARDQEFDMVTVRTTDPAPYYLRFGVADQITDDGFISRGPSSGSAVSRGLPDWVPPATAGVSSQRYRADVEVVNFDMRLLPVYQQVVTAENLDSAWFYDPSTNQIFSRRTSINSKSYGFEFIRTQYTAQALRTAGTIPANDTGARELTGVPQIPQVTTLVAELTAGKSTQYDRVRAIHDHFKNGFTYTLTTEPATSPNAIVDFLTAKKGFCVQYAAAMAWLVRAAGYPARVAFGFTRGDGATNGVYSLTNFNLHAWTEVFFQDFGWVPFDATPAGAVQGSVASSWAPPDIANPNNPEDDPEGEVGNPANPTPAPTGGPVPRDPGEDLIPEAGATPISPWLYGGAAAVLLTVLLLLAPSWRRRALRRQRRSRSGDLIVIGESGAARPGEPAIVADEASVAVARRDAHAAWSELLDTMIDYDVPVDHAETPRTTSVRLTGLSGLSPASHAPADLLAHAEERARYAKAPLRAHGLDDATRVMREALAQRATRWQRLHAAVLPKSVLQRWRAAWVGWTSAVVGVAARVRAVTLAVSPRRLIGLRRT